MFEIFGTEYYIDIDAISEKCSIQPKVRMEDEYKTDDIREEDSENEGENNESETILEINVFKYDIVKMCLDKVLTESNNNEDDDEIFNGKKTDTSFKLAFNTLINYEIIKDTNNE